MPAYDLGMGKKEVDEGCGIAVRFLLMHSVNRITLLRSVLPPPSFLILSLFVTRMAFTPHHCPAIVTRSRR